MPLPVFLSQNLAHDAVPQILNEIKTLKQTASKKDLWYPLNVQPEIESLEWLHALILFCQGERVSASIRTNCHYSDMHDVQCFLDVTNTYLEQKKSGMACMLSSFAPLLEDYAAFLSKVLENKQN